MKPTIEEVREYFKDALEIRSLFGIEFTGFNNLHLWNDSYYVEDSIGKSRLIWDEESGYATITKTKQNYETRYKDKEVNGMDVIDLCKHWNLNFNEGNVIKYLLRDKGDRIGDLKKIIDYAQRELKHVSK